MLYICNIFFDRKDVMNELMYLIRNIMIAAVCEDGCYLFDYEYCKHDNNRHRYYESRFIFLAR